MLSAVAAAACSASPDTTALLQPVDSGDAATDAGSDAAMPSTLDTSGLTSPFSCTVLPGLGDYALGVGFEQLRPLLGLDYLAIRRQPFASQMGDAAAEPPTDSAKTGVACSGASNPTACAAALAALRAPESQGQFFQHYDVGPSGGLQYLVYTRGDEVGSVLDRVQLLALLGPIDAPEKAALVAQQQGYSPQCDEPWVRPDGDGFVLLTRLELASCPFQFADVLLSVAADGTVTELQRSERPVTTACAGRRPEGLVLAGREDSPEAYFAHVAQLEAASIDAFDILRDELVAHGAPQSLVEAADAAARDEVRHARAMSKLAVRFGAAEPVRPEVIRGPVRSFEAIAVENAREGCVREAYAALEAAWQARFAADSHVQRTLSAIARDEVCHAELAWHVAAWLDEQLDTGARARVDAARLEALHELEAELTRRSAPPAGTGLPSRAQALALLRQLEPITAQLAA